MQSLIVLSLPTLSVLGKTINKPNIHMYSAQSTIEPKKHGIDGALNLSITMIEESLTKLQIVHAYKQNNRKSQDKDNPILAIASHIL